MPRYDRTDPILGILVALVMLGVVYAQIGGIATLVVIAGVVLMARLYPVLRGWALRIAPCEHGERGARQNRWLCTRCWKADEEREETQRRQQEAARKEAEFKAKRTEEERRQRSAEWLAKVRLPEYLRAMHPEEFEGLVSRLFAVRGFEVSRTPYSGDGGVDAYLRKDGKLILLQCKRVKGSVGEPVLRDLWGTIKHADASGGIIVTTGTVSSQAKRWAKGKDIKIVELEELRQLIDQTFTESAVVPDTFVVQASRLCPKCGRRMRVVRGRRGKFLGCSGYPTCKYSRSGPLRGSLGGAIR